ncbi:glycosyl hydrolase [Devosia sp. 17-2-E-8]|nr:glycosyl hydrolase [Devosia sp. 17-2-E-8]
MAAPVIHVVFKTHLDIGFTDHAEKVRRQYHERFIPQAIDTGEHFFRENPDEPRFIWTTGAWLIWDHLNSRSPAEIARLEQAIERGLITWHALPYTTHSELMSPALFRAGLSYAAELDKRFGRQTIAAKMTDVPGHTLGIVPLMAQAGIRFLHLGVNTASPPPDVPDVFRWRAPSGEEIVVMYQKSYGATHFPQGFTEGLSFAHTSDNIGPQSVPQTSESLREIAAHNPGATLRASTLDAYAALLWDRRAEFPVLDIELGDSWIHGSASDPVKSARFRALQRTYDAFESEGLTPSRLAFGRELAMVAEHTCGVDIKSYLRDDKAWDRPAFEAARKTDYRFAYTEASWAEQRAYLDRAVDHLDQPDRARAEAGLAELDVPAAAAPTARASAQTLALDGWSLELTPTGDVASLTAPSGTRLQGLNGSLLGFRHESYDSADIAHHMDTYLTHRAEWAILDHDKPGLAKAHTARSASWQPTLAGRIASGFALTLPPQAHTELGAPARVDLAFAPIDQNTIELTLTLREKPANRMPEAGFLTFTPAGNGSWDFLKTGLWQPANDVAAHGGGQLQAIFAARRNDIAITPLDTPLAAPAATPFMPFDRNPPDFDAGLRFNLHNNKWGTNFPMWWEGDFKARFRITLG